MADSGVESLRIVDRLAVARARQGLHARPPGPAGAPRVDTPTSGSSSTSPRARAGRRRATNPPEFWRARRRTPAPYADIMRHLVRRYGPRGSFWTAEPRRPADADPPVAGVERAHCTVVLVRASRSRRATRSCCGHVQGHPRAPTAGASVATGGLVDRAGPRRGRRPKDLYRAARQGHVRRPCGPPVHQRLPLGEARSGGPSSSCRRVRAVMRRSPRPPQADRADRGHVAGRGRPRPRRARSTASRQPTLARRRDSTAPTAPWPRAQEARRQPGLLVHVGVGAHER